MSDSQQPKVLVNRKIVKDVLCLGFTFLLRKALRKFAQEKLEDPLKRRVSAVNEVL